MCLRRLPSSRHASYTFLGILLNLKHSWAHCLAILHFRNILLVQAQRNNKLLNRKWMNYYFSRYPYSYLYEYEPLLPLPATRCIVQFLSWSAVAESHEVLRNPLLHIPSLFWSWHDTARHAESCKHCCFKTVSSTSVNQVQPFVLTHSL